MERRLKVRLPKDLAEQLARAAARVRQTRSDVARLALEQFLTTGADTRPMERVRDLLGRVESGLPDLGQRHREYLLKRLRDGK